MIKKVLPTYLIALTTGSSAAAFAECVDCCERKLGIDRKLVDFGLPMGIVIFMPNFALWLVLFGGASAEYAGTVLTPADLLAVAVIGVFLAVAAPPVPGGAITCYTILLMQMNMPMEMLAVAAAVNVVLDFTGTAGHMLANQIELLQCAADLGMLDRKKLEN
ncbi:cation:dicarboxylate symporter family transporter [Enterocloster hominis (ex Hitch et al. 2024)]|uniref:cation:dicarboxylate symporter family transporter n=1 Tax=Enterocloster hominis (ex Hitch et al. 2024) TaxID=1917870 RepID=UPI002E36B703|nr:cation:dicarboxylase symporter family transporter [Lachnoclostridium pacaense]